MALAICFLFLRISFGVKPASQVCLRRCLCIFNTSYTPLSVASVSTLLPDIWFSTCPSNSQHCHSFSYPLVYLLQTNHPRSSAHSVGDAWEQKLPIAPEIAYILLRLRPELTARILVSGPLCSLDFTRFFASLIWSLKPPKTTTLRKRCPVRSLSFALGVWSSVFVGQRPYNSGSVNYLYLLFGFRPVIHFAQFKSTSAMFVSSPRLPPRLPFCSQGKITSPQ